MDGLREAFLFLYVFILLVSEVNAHFWRDFLLYAPLWLCLFRDRGDRNESVRSCHLLSLHWEVKCQPTAWNPLLPPGTSISIYKSQSEIWKVEICANISWYGSSEGKEMSLSLASPKFLSSALHASRCDKAKWGTTWTFVLTHIRKALKHGLKGQNCSLFPNEFPRQLLILLNLLKLIFTSFCWHSIWNK